MKRSACEWGNRIDFVGLEEAEYGNRRVQVVGVGLVERAILREMTEIESTHEGDVET